MTAATPRHPIALIAITAIASLAFVTAAITAVVKHATAVRLDAEVRRIDSELKHSLREIDRISRESAERERAVQSKLEDEQRAHASLKATSQRLVNEAIDREMEAVQSVFQRLPPSDQQRILALAQKVGEEGDFSKATPEELEYALANRPFLSHLLDKWEARQKR